LFLTLVTFYLLNIKKCVDSSVAIGSPISNDDHVEAILDDVSEKFDGFVTAILSNLDTYSVEKVEALLLS